MDVSPSEREQKLIEGACEVRLRIRHPNLDPDEITKELGLVPDHCWKGGDIRPAIGEEISSKHRAETYWIAPVQFQSPFEHLPSLEEKLVMAALALKNSKTIWKKLSTGGGRVDLLVTIRGEVSASLDLESEAMSLLRGIGLSISIATHRRSAAA